MADTWITDMQHFVGIDDPSLDVPARARKIGEYLGRIVSAAVESPSHHPLDWQRPCAFSASPRSRQRL